MVFWFSTSYFNLLISVLWSHHLDALLYGKTKLPILGTLLQFFHESEFLIFLQHLYCCVLTGPFLYLLSDHVRLQR